MAIKSNIWNLQVGDVIAFTNKVNYPVIILVTRVEEKSWYSNGRNSWGTLESYSKSPDFKIVKKPVITVDNNDKDYCMNASQIDKEWFLYNKLLSNLPVS